MIRRRIAALLRAVRGWFRRHREGLRSLLIVVLVAALIGQSGLLWSHVLEKDKMPAPIRSLLSLFASSEQTTDNAAAALPIRFAARGDDGLYGIQYNADGLEDAYETTADVWAQAWENADALTLSDNAAYREALRQEMLLMDYDGTVPLTILTGWLNVTLADSAVDCAAGTVALCCNTDNTYTLFVRDSQTGSIFSAQTSVDDTLFDTTVGQFEPNDCTLAADEDDAAVSPDLLYFPGGETFDVLSFDAYRADSGWEDILTAFGMDADAALDSAYTTDNVTVYVSGSNTIRLADDGSMRYDGISLRISSTQGNDRLMQYVQLGYELTCDAVDAIGSGATAVLTDAYTDEDGRYIAVFGLQIGGVPVDNAVTGYFARYEFEGDTMVHANLALRTSQTTGETITVMPEKQTAASLDGTVSAVLSLRYVDEAAGSDSSWEQLYDTDDTDDLWNAENSDDTELDTAWNDFLDDALDDVDDELDTAWYDTTGTPVSPQWYALHYGGEDNLLDDVRTIDPEDIVVVQADFDRMIQGGGAS